jgi:putative IMPACT (imprinted ancient) family translation regulator
MNVVLEGAVAGIEVKHSKFIAEAFVLGSLEGASLPPGRSQALPVSSTPPTARVIIKQQKERYRDASHVVHAFIAGEAGEIRGMSDDGEPGGTAARPIMDILAGAHCTNILITVTRYFGGTLLGTGGLVRAYGDAARAVLVKCKIGPLPPPCRRLKCAVPYGRYESLARALSALGAVNICPDWAAAADAVSLTAAIPLPAWPAALDILQSYGIKCED